MHEQHFSLQIVTVTQVLLIKHHPQSNSLLLAEKAIHGFTIGYFLHSLSYFPLCRTPTEDDRKLFDQQQDEYKQGMDVLNLVCKIFRLSDTCIVEAT